MPGSSQPQFDRTAPAKDRGAGLIEYALVVSLIAIIGFGAVKAVGGATADAFNGMTQAVGGTETTTTTTPEMTPKQKWEKAQEDWAAAIAEANAQYKADVAAAQATYDAAKAANNSLPKAEKKAANAQAAAELKSAKQNAKANQHAAKAAANAAKAAAKAEYQATK